MSAAQQRGRKQDLVYRALRDRILSNDLRPGDRLRIDEITRQHEVSHIPVREALKQLQAEGFVTVEPYVGTTVADLPMEWVEEVFEAKEALELIGGRAACLAMDEEALAQVAVQVREMDDLVTDPEAWSQANVRLHRLICTEAGKPFVGEMLGRVLDQWDRLRRRYLEEVSAQRLEHAQAEHHEILASLQARDVEGLSTRISEHNRNALEAYARHLKLID
ncbi:MAG: GntR family transcriptional regulator [Trueperaceae bacterium]